jgi:hypothetical protein
MESGDALWAGAWFITGLLTFRFTSLKSTLIAISGIITAISILGGIFEPDELIKFLANYPISDIGSTLTNFVYLVGANLVRGDQFHTEIKWNRIIMYGIAIVVLLIILHNIPSASNPK